MTPKKQILLENTFDNAEMSYLCVATSTAGHCGCIAVKGINKTNINIENKTKTLHLISLSCIVLVKTQIAEIGALQMKSLKCKSCKLFKLFRLIDTKRCSAADASQPKGFPLSLIENVILSHIMFKPSGS